MEGLNLLSVAQALVTLVREKGRYEDYVPPTSEEEKAATTLLGNLEVLDSEFQDAGSGGISLNRVALGEDIEQCSGETPRITTTNKDDEDLEELIRSSQDLEGLPLPSMVDDHHIDLDEHVVDGGGVDIQLDSTLDVSSQEDESMTILPSAPPIEDDDDEMSSASTLLMGVVVEEDQDEEKQVEDQEEEQGNVDNSRTKTSRLTNVSDSSFVTAIETDEEGEPEGNISLSKDEAAGNVENHVTSTSSPTATVDSTTATPPDNNGIGISSYLDLSIEELEENGAVVEEVEKVTTVPESPVSKRNSLKSDLITSTLVADLLGGDDDDDEIVILDSDSESGRINIRTSTSFPNPFFKSSGVKNEKESETAPSSEANQEAESESDDEGGKRQTRSKKKTDTKSRTRQGNSESEHETESTKKEIVRRSTRSKTLVPLSKNKNDAEAETEQVKSSPEPESASDNEESTKRPTRGSFRRTKEKEKNVDKEPTDLVAEEEKNTDKEPSKKNSEADKSFNSTLDSSRNSNDSDTEPLMAVKPKKKGGTNIKSEPEPKSDGDTEKTPKNKLPKASTKKEKEASASEDEQGMDLTIGVKHLVDGEKPSTSKKVTAELARAKRLSDRQAKLSKNESFIRNDLLGTSEAESDGDGLSESKKNDKDSRKKGKEKETEEAKRKKDKEAIKRERETRSSRRKSLVPVDGGEDGSGSDDDDEPPSLKGRRGKAIQMTKEDIEKDPKLNLEANVELQRLDPRIEAKLKSDLKVVIDEDIGEDVVYDTDSSVARLNKAIRKMVHFNAKIISDSQNRRRARKLKKDKPKHANKGEKEEELPKNSDDSDFKQPSITLRPLKDLVESCSDMEDLDVAEKSKADKNKKDGSKQQSKGQKRKADEITISDSDDEAEKKALGSSEDDSEKPIAVKRTKKNRKSDSDGGGSSKGARRRKKAATKKPRKRITSDDSDNYDPNDSDASEPSSSKLSSNSDSDFVSAADLRKKRQKTRRHSSDDDDLLSDSSRKKTGKKPRKRIKPANSSSEDSDGNKRNKRKNKDKKVDDDDSDVEELDGDGQVIPRSQKRKDIRKIISKKELKKTTREAEKEEEERKKRVAENQKLFNGVFTDEKSIEDGKVKQVILDVDPKTKEIRIELAQCVAEKLKPHQADGIKFMYTSCYESIEMMKEGKGAGGCILAHCMGLGKTLQTIAFIHTMLEHHEVTEAKRVLVVCPLNTVNNWYKEFQMWLEDVPSDKMPRLHSLWDGNVTSKLAALKTWERRGGVGIIHYDAFRALVNSADIDGTQKRKKKMKERDAAIIKSTLLDPGPDIIICDEGHLLKNSKSKLSLALSQVKTVRRVVLTGTPLQNNLVEYHTMVNFVKPNLLGTLKEFTNRFVNPIKNGQCKDSSERDVKVMKRRAHVLHSKLNGCVQRMDFSVLTPYLPAKHEYCIIIKLSDKQKELYRHYIDNVVPAGIIERSRELLKHYSVLIKILAHPVVLSLKTSADKSDDDEEGSMKDFIDDEDDEVTSPSSDSDIECLDDDGNAKEKKTKRKNTRANPTANGDDNSNSNLPEEPVGKNKQWWSPFFAKKEDMYSTDLSGKLIVLQEILRVCETIGDRVLVFSQYLSTLNIIEEFLKEWDDEAATKGEEGSKGRWRANKEYFRIDGSTKTDDRQKQCDTFNKKNATSKAKLFLISTKAGGLGINLFGANRVVIFDASWNPSNDMQSIFRVYRFGQQKPCYIYRFVAQATMEEKIYNRQVVKLSLSSRVVDEHQIDRHFKFDDITAMYKFDPDEVSDRPTPPVPKDRLLADLMSGDLKEWLNSYFEHDSLLQNRQEEELTEEERQQAWDEYRNESENRFVPQVVNNSIQDKATYDKIVVKLGIRFPTAQPPQIHASAVVVLQKVQELRLLVSRLNLESFRNSPEWAGELERKIRSLQNWISNALGGSLDAPTPNPRQVPPHLLNLNTNTVGGVPMGIIREQQRRQQQQSAHDIASRLNMQNQFMESMLRAQGVTISPAHTMRGNPNPSIAQSAAGQQFQNFLAQRLQQSSGGGVPAAPASLSDTLTLD